jgi:hypothetical protein
MIFSGTFESNSSQPQNPLAAIFASKVICGNIIIEINETNPDESKCTITYTGTYMSNQVISFKPTLSRDPNLPHILNISGQISIQKMYFNLIHEGNINNIPLNEHVSGNYNTVNPGDSGIVRVIRFK